MMSYPEVLINPGRGHDPIELQKAIDTDLITEDKTIVGALNTLAAKCHIEPVDRDTTDFDNLPHAGLYVVTHNGTIENFIIETIVNGAIRQYRFGNDGLRYRDRLIITSSGETTIKWATWTPITNAVYNYVDTTFATKAELGDIETALDSIIAIQNELIGGDTA